MLLSCIGWILFHTISLIYQIPIAPTPLVAILAVYVVLVLPFCQWFILWQLLCATQPLHCHGKDSVSLTLWLLVLFQEASCAYVLIVTAVYWVSEAIPLGAAALVPAFLYPLFGVLKSSEVASEYFKDTTLLLIGVICLAASIEKWNLHKRLALRMVMIAGAKPGIRYPEAQVINFGSWFIFSLPISLIMLFLTWVWLHCLFLGCKKGYRTDATISVLLGFLLFLIPSRKPCFSQAGDRDQGSSSEDEEDSDTLAPMITWKDFQKLMPWEIVILVGGGYALAAGCKVSGLSVWMGRQLEPMNSLPPWTITLLACLLVSAVTEFASNPATITVFLPILSTMSETLHINPLYTLIPATMCVSFGVMLPVGNPPNAIVFSYGHCQVSDMVNLANEDLVDPRHRSVQKMLLHYICLTMIF
ncbi:UNVERIFIED_CONTAM: hypothetical protein FKN15_068266 [Acipenser sinensis]